MAEEEVVRKISSAGECYSDFGERVHQFITGKSSVTGDPLEA